MGGEQPAFCICIFFTAADMTTNMPTKCRRISWRRKDKATGGQMVCKALVATDVLQGNALDNAGDVHCLGSTGVRAMRLVIHYNTYIHLRPREN